MNRWQWIMIGGGRMMQRNCLKRLRSLAGMGIGSEQVTARVLIGEVSGGTLRANRVRRPVLRCPLPSLFDPLRFSIFRRPLPSYSVFESGSGAFLRTVSYRTKNADDLKP